MQHAYSNNLVENMHTQSFSSCIGVYWCINKWDLLTPLHVEEDIATKAIRDIWVS